jgi:hypothetical protein
MTTRSAAAHQSSNGTENGNSSTLGPLTERLVQAFIDGQNANGVHADDQKGRWTAFIITLLIACSTC